MFVVAAVIWGGGVFGSLANRGFDSPGSEASRAMDQIESILGRDGVDVIVLYDDPRRTVDDPTYRKDVETALAKLPGGSVMRTATFWSTHSPTFVSKDRHSTYAALTSPARRPRSG